MTSGRHNRDPFLILLPAPGRMSRPAKAAAKAPDGALSPQEERYAWEVLGVVMIGTLMSALDTSIVNVSLPAIMADFGSSTMATPP